MVTHHPNQVKIGYIVEHIVGINQDETLGLLSYFWKFHLSLPRDLKYKYLGAHDLQPLIPDLTFHQCLLPDMQQYRVSFGEKKGGNIEKSSEEKFEILEIKNFDQISAIQGDQCSVISDSQFFLGSVNCELNEQH